MRRTGLCTTILLIWFLLPAAAQEPEAPAQRPLPTDSVGIIDLSPREFDALVRSQARARQTRMRAQEQQYMATASRHRLTLTYGVVPLLNDLGYTAWEAMDKQNPAYELMYSKYTEDCYGRRSSGAFALTYTYQLSPTWEVGASVCYIHYFNHLRMNEITFSRSLSEHHLCVMPLVRVLWTNKPSLRLYTGLEFGVQTAFHRGFYDRKYSTSIHYSGQCTLLGLQYGERIYFNAELGFGARGTITVGIGWKIDAKKERGL